MSSNCECVLGRRVGTHGYAVVCIGHARDALAHRLAWEDEYGEIPEGMQLHHVCENKACVNVEHLELVTPKEHRRRHWNCDHDERYVSAQGYMRCHECDRRRQRKYEQQRRLALV